MSSGIGQFSPDKSRTWSGFTQAFREIRLKADIRKSDAKNPVATRYILYLWQHLEAARARLERVSGAVALAAVLLLALPQGLQASEDLPGLGDGNAVINLAQEKQLGSSWLRRLRAQVPLYDDPLALDYLDDLIYLLTPNSRLIDRDLTLVMIDSPDLNAFAVPGGVVGVNAGMFLHAYSEQELASVLAHELAHISQRHFARRLEDQNKHLALNMAGLLASVIIAASGGGDAGLAALASTQALSLQKQLSYSRQNEQEADRIGITTLAASGMNAAAMVEMFERMMQSQRYNRQVPEYLRTHPLTESRISDLSERAANLPAVPYRENIDFYFIQARVRTYYAGNLADTVELFRTWQKHSYELIRKAGLYGEVLARISQKQAELATASMDELWRQASDRLSVQYLRAEWLNGMGRHAEARRFLTESLKLSPDYYPLSRQLASTLVLEGNYAEAEQLLWKLSRQQPEDIGLWYELSEVAGKAGSIVRLHRARAEFYYLRADLGNAQRQLEQALTKSGSDYVEKLLIRNRLNDIRGTGQHFNF